MPYITWPLLWTAAWLRAWAAWLPARRRARLRLVAVDGRRVER